MGVHSVRDSYKILCSIVQAKMFNNFQLLKIIRTLCWLVSSHFIYDTATRHHIRYSNSLLSNNSRWSRWSIWSRFGIVSRLLFYVGFSKWTSNVNCDPFERYSNVAMLHRDLWSSLWFIDGGTNDTSSKPMVGITFQLDPE